MLRKAITQYVTVQENANRFANSDRNKFVEATTRSMNRSSADVFTNNVRGARRLPCIFCKGSHYNDECDKYVTLSDRKKRLSQQARCFICLKIGHMSKGCPNSQKKPCAHCGKKAFHNRCLCPEKFALSTVNFTTGPSDSSSDSVLQGDNSGITSTTQSLLDGIIEVVDKLVVSDTRKYYLPHHPVITPNKAIQNNIYVDNVLIGVKSVNEAYEKYKEAKMMFEKASMNLREWNYRFFEFYCSC